MADFLLLPVYDSTFPDEIQNNGILIGKRNNTHNVYATSISNSENYIGYYYNNGTLTALPLSLASNPYISACPTLFTFVERVTTTNTHTIDGNTIYNPTQVMSLTSKENDANIFANMNALLQAFSDFISNQLYPIEYVMTHVNAQGPTSAVIGQDVVVTLTPNDGYKLTSVAVEDEAGPVPFIRDGDTIAFTMPGPIDA